MSGTAGDRADAASQVPVPDPTVLTTEALARAITAERDYTDGQLDVLRERLRGIDRATELLNETVNRVPTDLQREVGHLRELTEERGRSVAQELALGERQRIEQKADTKAAVDAALTAQKEAVREQTTASERAIAKSEASTTKQFEQLTARFDQAIKGVTDTQNDLKERVGRIESVKQGGKEALYAVYALVGFLVMLLTIGGALAASGAFDGR